MINCHIYTLLRESSETPIQVHKPDADVGSKPSTTVLLDMLQSKLRSTQQKRLGRIDPESESNGKALPCALRAWHDQNTDFDALSWAIAESFEEGLREWDDTFRGHLMVATQVMFEQRFLWVYWLQEREAWEVDAQGELRAVASVDTGQLKYAASVQVSTWAKDPEALSLTMVTARGVPELTQSFENAFQLIDEQDKLAETGKFLEVVEGYAELLDDEQAAETRKEVVSYCLDKARSGEEADIKELSGQLNPSEPEAFANFVYEHDQDARAPANPDAKSLKDYVRFAGRDKDLSISFSSHLVGHGVTYNATENSLLLEQLPAALKEQLERHIKH